VKFFVKLLLKAGIALGVMFIGYKYILTGGAGGFQIPGMDGLSNKADKGISTIENAVVEKDVTVYQWVDDKGVTHYGGTPPAGQGEYAKKEIRANTNVISALKVSEEPEEVEMKSRVSRVGSVYSPEGVKKLMDDAGDISKTLDERAAKQEELLNNL